MKNKSYVASLFFAKAMALTSLLALVACAGTNSNDQFEYAPVSTPTVDYVEGLDVYSAPHKDSFLNQLAMNYRSYAIYNARTSGYADMGELFAQKAVAAFSGELPFPETLNNWPVENEQDAFELNAAYNELMAELQNDASSISPELAAEAQAKFDCWLSASASGQEGTANECRDRYQKTMTALRDCKGGKIVNSRAEALTVNGDAVVETEKTVSVVQNTVNASNKPVDFYPETRGLSAMNGAGKAREGVIIVNNVNVPEHLIKPVPVVQPQPLVFNQNIFGGDETITKNKTTKNISKNNNNSTLDLVALCPMGNFQCFAEDVMFVPVEDVPADYVAVSDIVPADVRTVELNEEMLVPDYVVRESYLDAENLMPPRHSHDGKKRMKMLSDEIFARMDLQDENVSALSSAMTARASVREAKIDTLSGDIITLENKRDAQVRALTDDFAQRDELRASQIKSLSEEMVSRDEFINMMIAMREELQAINARLDTIQANSGETTMIKVQQIPLEPKQHVMEEVLEVQFDFNKSAIKPEYAALIKQLVDATQSNKNIKVSVVGHTDTMGSKDYNYSLGGKRAEAVQKMLIGYGVPASQIVAVSAGEEDLAVPTADGVANAKNRRVQVVKEVHYTEPAKTVPVADVSVNEISINKTCGLYGCTE